MAENQEDIIILEEGDEEIKQQNNDNDIPQSGDKKIKILIVLLSILLLIIVIILILVLTKKNKTNNSLNITKLTQKIKKKEHSADFSPLKLENLIKKANILYNNGDKKDALKLYKKIASFNESISNYNIGVAKMKEKKYKIAIKYFKKAIKNGQNRCVSSINSAVCALKMGNKKLFKYYISLAKIYLPYETKHPLYSYYVSLINYYQGYYFESLIPMNHPSSKYYTNTQNYISSKINTFFRDDFSAINFLEKNKNLGNNLTLGLLYARVGEYSLAVKHFLMSYKANNEPLKSKMAMVLSYINMGLLGNAAVNLKEAFESFGAKSMDIYPVSIKLQPSLYDIKLAQKDFKKNIFLKKGNEYGLLFYFAPYKVFNANQTIDFIRKGSLNISLGKIKSALMLLSQSSAISKINKDISLGIQKALSFKVNEANKIFNSLKGTYPNHSVLHYDLGLSFAQMGNYTLAYKNFVKSYHLNSKNYIAGIFAIITKNLIHQDNQKLIEELVGDLNADNKVKNKKFLLAMVSFAKNNIISAASFAQSDNSKKPLNLIFDALVAKNINNNKLFLKKAEILKTILPKDMIAQTVFINAKMHDKSMQEYAKTIQTNFLKNKVDFKSLFYGPIVARDIYIESLQISGMMYYVRDILEKQLQDENSDVVGVMQALAFVDIYTKNYEEAYAIYNELIDNYKQKDTNTLFLASVASIAAGHDANAIALLELSKLTDPNNFESRFALGLLYLEVKNPIAAQIQFDKIGNSNFKSKYFSFKIVKKVL